MVGKLKDSLLSEQNLPSVINDCKALIDAQVAKKRGVSGLAIKAGYKTVKKFRPDVIEKTLDSLLPEFVEKMEPFFETYESSGSSKSVRDYVSGRSSEMAGALLSITDGRADRTQFKTLKGAYKKLRPFAQTAVEDALPDVGELVSKYM